MTTLQNAKHEAVLQAFIADKNRVAWRAYASIYSGISESAAHAAASRLFKNVNIAARLKELESAVVDNVVEATGITVERVVEELALLGLSNVADYLHADKDGNAIGVDLKKLTRQQSAAIAEVSIETIKGKGKKPAKIVHTRLKLHDKRGPLTDLLKHLGGLVERHEHTGKNGKPIETKDVSEMGELELGRRIAFALEKAARAASKRTKK